MAQVEAKLAGEVVTHMRIDRTANGKGVEYRRVRGLPAGHDGQGVLLIEPFEETVIDEATYLEETGQ